MLLVLALLVGFVTADAGKVFGKLSQAYRAHKAPGEMGAENMQPEMAQDQPEMMAEDDEEKMMDPSMMEQAPPMDEGHERDNRYNPYYGHYYMKLIPYGYATGLYPHGGVVYVNDHMGMDVNNQMEDHMQRYPHPNVVT